MQDLEHSAAWDFNFLVAQAEWVAIHSLSIATHHCNLYRCRDQCWPIRRCQCIGTHTSAHPGSNGIGVEAALSLEAPQQVHQLRFSLGGSPSGRSSREGHSQRGLWLHLGSPSGQAIWVPHLSVDSAGPSADPLWTSVLQKLHQQVAEVGSWRPGVSALFRFYICTFVALYWRFDCSQLIMSFWWCVHWQLVFSIERMNDWVDHLTSFWLVKPQAERILCKLLVSYATTYLEQTYSIWVLCHYVVKCQNQGLTPCLKVNGGRNKSLPSVIWLWLELNHDSVSHLACCELSAQSGVIFMCVWALTRVWFISWIYSWVYFYLPYFPDINSTETSSLV